MKIKDFLTKENWTQGANARDKNGNTVYVFSEHACQFCLLGAIMKLYPPSERDEVDYVLRCAINLKSDYTSISHFNDNSDFNEVKCILDTLDI